MTAQAVTEEGLALYRRLGTTGPIAGTGYALENLGLVARLKGDLGQAQALCEEGLTCFRAAGDEAAIAQLTASLGLILRDRRGISVPQGARCGAPFPP